MTSLHSRRERVLAEAVVSNYINELATPRERVRPAHRPERPLARVVQLRRERARRQPELLTA
jgi:hypothetical protein